jgi:uncharacterized membrane protein YbhN (UPF0104 family)
MMKSRIQFVARYAIAGLVIYWLSRSGVVDWSGLRQQLHAVDVLAAAMAVFVVDMIVTARRLVVLLDGRGFGMSLADALRLSLVGNLFNLVLPSGGGDVARFVYTSANAAGRRTELAAILLFDRLVGLVTLLALPALLLPFLPTEVASSTVLRALLAAAGLTSLTLLVGLTVVMIPAAGLPAPISWIIRRFPFASRIELFLGAIRGYREHPSILAHAVALSVVAHVLSGIVIAILHSTNGGFSIRAGVLSLLGFVANSLPLTPGGLGVGEAAFGALFREAGLTGGAEALLSWRLLLLALAPVGLLIHLRGLRITLAMPAQ